MSFVLTRIDSSLGELNVADINRGITNLLFSVNQVLGSSPGNLTNSLVSIHQTPSGSNTARLSEEVRPARIRPVGPLERM